MLPSPTRVFILCAALLFISSGCSRHENAQVAPAKSRAARTAVIEQHHLHERLRSREIRERANENPDTTHLLANANADTLARPFIAFSDWAAAWKTADAQERASLLAQGEPIARERRAALKTLIELDPELALQLALDDETRRALPPQIAALLEKPVAATGSYEVDIACGLPAEGAHDSHDAHQDTLTRTFTAEGVSYRAFTFGDRLAVTTKVALPVNGIAIDGALAIAGSAVQRLGTDADGRISYQVGEKVGVAESEEEFAAIVAEQTAAESALGPYGASAASPWTEGAKTMLYIRVAFSDSPTVEPLSLAQAQANQAVVDQFYRENSYGKISLTTTFTPLIVLPNTEAYYNSQSWTVLMADARAGAKALGPLYDSANYTLNTTVARKLSSMSWAGRAAVGGTYSHINGDYALRVTAHEFGHNFGLYHANYNYTSGENPISTEAYAAAPANSPMSEYGHRYTMMGASGTTTSYHFTAREKALLDWIPTSDNVAAVASGTYRLYRHDHADAFTGLRSLRVPTGDATRTHFWLSLRKLFPSTTNNFGAGAEVLWGRPTNVSGGTLLADMTPYSNDGPHADSYTGDNNDKADAALTEGRMFGSADAGAWFTIVGQGGTAPAEYLDVAVNIGNFSQNRTPTVSLTPATATVAIGQTLTLNATSSDPDGDTVYYSWDFGDGTVGGNQASITKSWAITGTYTVRVIAVDGKGATASARCVVRVGNATTFTATGRVTSKGKPLEGVRVHNGLTGTAYRASRTDSNGVFTIANLPAGSYSLQARADNYAFQTEFSNPVTVSSDMTSLNFTATNAPGDYVIVDNGDASGIETIGSWSSLTTTAGFYAQDYVTDGNTGKGTKQITFRPTIPTTGLYRVYMRYTAGSTRAKNVPVDILHNGGTNTFAVDQTQNGGLWNYLGTFEFTAGTTGYARVRTTGTTATVAVDSFKFEAATTQDPTVRLSLVQGIARERGAVPATVRIEREGPLNFPLVVYLGTNPAAENSAIADVDYAALPSSVTIPADADHYDVNLTPVPDNEAEGDETAIVALRQPPNPTELWEFNDASGTTLNLAANSADGGVNWSSALDASTTTSGVLRIRRDSSSTGPSTSWALLPNPNPGTTQYLIVQVSAWTLSGTTLESVRLGFTTSANSTVTAQMVISRTADGMTLAGEANGTGSTAIAPVLFTPNITSTDVYTFVLAIDPIGKTYRILYRRGTDTFATAGTGTIAPDRPLGALRISLLNNFASSTSEKFDIDRIVLTAADPTQPSYLIVTPSEVAVTIKDDPRDEWRLKYFDSVALDDDTISGWRADPDGDGLTNLQEYAFNRRPLTMDATIPINATTSNTEGVERVSLTFERRTDDTGLVYTPEGTSDLVYGPWLDATAYSVSVQPGSDPAYETVTFVDNVALQNGKRRFLRVRVQLNP